MSKNITLVVGILTALTFQSVFAFQPKETAQYFNGPTIGAVGSTSAQVLLSQAVLGALSDEEKAGVYFEYYETQQVCIMIYPTPESCLPKKTEIGKSSVTLANLKPATSYTVFYKKDNTIRCIATPCPENGFESLKVEFVTKVTTTPTDNLQITKNLKYKSRGEQVIALQTFLINHGYLSGSATGYFGVLTLKAVKDFQRENYITPTGLVGPATRGVMVRLSLNPSSSVMTETFEGTITAYSTACFSDGECSITVDGKKVVTTIGRYQQVVGKVTGIPDFGSIENKVGTHAKVYARKTTDGYTLYGSADYYVHVK